MNTDPITFLFVCTPPSTPPSPGPPVLLDATWAPTGGIHGPRGEGEEVSLLPIIPSDPFRDWAPPIPASMVSEFRGPTSERGPFCQWTWHALCDLPPTCGCLPAHRAPHTRGRAAGRAGVGRAAAAPSDGGQTGGWTPSVHLGSSRSSLAPFGIKQKRPRPKTKCSKGSSGLPCEHSSPRWSEEMGPRALGGRPPHLYGEAVRSSLRGPWWTLGRQFCPPHPLRPNLGVPFAIFILRHLTFLHQLRNVANPATCQNLLCKDQFPPGRPPAVACPALPLRALPAGPGRLGAQVSPQERGPRSLAQVTL